MRSGPDSFDSLQIAALGPAPSPPVPSAERTHGGKIRGVTIWTPENRGRLRRAFAIGGERGVLAAFPDWDAHALRSAIARYVGGDGPPTEFDPADFHRRLSLIPPTQLVERIQLLLRGGRERRAPAILD